VFFYHCNVVLYRRSKARKETLIKPINLTGWALFSCIVTVRVFVLTPLTLDLSSHRTHAFQHFMFDIYAASVAFIVPPGQLCAIGPLSHAQIFYLVLDSPANVAYSAIYVLTTIIADSFLVSSNLL